MADRDAVIKIEMKSTQAQRALQLLGDRLDNLAREARKARTALVGVDTGSAPMKKTADATAKTTKKTKEAKASMSDFIDATGRLKLVPPRVSAIASSFDGLGESLKKAREFLGTRAGMAAGIGVGIAAVGAGAIAVTHSVAMTTNELSKSARQLGVSAKDLQVWRYHARLAGVETTELDSALATLQRQLFDISQGTGLEASRAFNALGLSVFDTSGKIKTAAQVMDDLARVLPTIADEGVRTGALMKILGNSGRDMATFFEGGVEAIARSKEELESFNGIIGARSLKNAEEYAKSVTRISTAFAGLKQSLAEPFIGPLAKFMELMSSPTMGRSPFASPRASAAEQAMFDAFQLPKIFDPSMLRAVLSQLGPTVADNGPWSWRSPGQSVPTGFDFWANRQTTRFMAPNFEDRWGFQNFEFRRSKARGISPDSADADIDLRGVSDDIEAQTNKWSEHLGRVADSLGVSIANAFTRGKQGVRELGEFIKSYLINEVLGGLLGTAIRAIFKIGGRSGIFGVINRVGSRSDSGSTPKRSIGAATQPSFAVNVTGVLPGGIVEVIRNDIQASRVLVREVVAPQQRALSMR
jgi:hypothetical protein